MARRPQSLRGRSGGIHNKEWESVCIATTSLDIAAGTLLSFALFVADEAETLLRTRGQIMAHFDPFAINESVTLGVGLAMVSARAAAAGAGSLPRPISEGSYPWLWHGFLMCDSFGPTLTAIDYPLVHRLEVDSKAMRKVKEDEQMVLMFEVCDSNDLGGLVTLSGGFRALTGD